MLKKIVNPLVVSAIALLPLMSACSSDASKQEAKSAPAKETAAPAKPAGPAEHVFNIEPKKVADGVWCMLGALEMPTAENAGFMSNSCYIQTNDGWVLWDTGATYKFAKATYEAMNKIVPDLEVKTILFSHEHDDHWLGSAYYKEKFNSKTIGTKIINERYKPGHEPDTRMFQILNPIDVEKTKIIPVDEIAKTGETTKLNLGGVEMEYISLNQAHSEDDFLLYLPGKKVILTADVVMNGRVTSNRNGTVMGQLAALELIKSKEWDVLVPGHGFNTGKTAMDESMKYFTQMKDQILAALDNDVEATEINEVVTLPDFKDKNMYDILNSNNVSRSYTELEMLD